MDNLPYTYINSYHNVVTYNIQMISNDKEILYIHNDNLRQ